ncbi:MAG: hypothetical protein QOD06_3031 [Candidatus Binatota bacterium]|jgi:signal recognition particle subunit SEC65|nr:hypothetical protein [Candidatus Binatota bacterium]
MPRKIYTVTPAAGEGWKIEGAREGRFLKKTAAIEKAKELASAHQPAQVRVKARNGRIEKEWKFPPSSGLRRTLG